MSTTRAFHWREYAIEAAALGTFMISACTVTALVEHPASPVRQSIADPLLRRLLVGIGMGLTAIAIIYSPWGKRSGAHINPATTLTFLRLGRVSRRDATFYVAAQFAGAVLGVLVAARVLGMVIADPAVAYVTTMPGIHGLTAAFAAEVAMTAVLMTVVLHTAASARLARFTGLFVGLMVATYITLEAPISGMSMNPARTFGSAVVAGQWTALWLYFTAPPLGMLVGAELFLRRRRPGAVPCAKMYHATDVPCIFCGHATTASGGASHAA